MKKVVFSVLVAMIFLFMQGSVFAHPGNTASDGCHYCRTNCDKWGVAWNERHCHNGSSSSSSSSGDSSSDSDYSLFWYGIVGLSGLGLGYYLFKNKD